MAWSFEAVFFQVGQGRGGRVFLEGARVVWCVSMEPMNGQYGNTGITGWFQAGGEIRKCWYFWWVFGSLLATFMAIRKYGYFSGEWVNR